MASELAVQENEAELLAASDAAAEALAARQDEEYDEDSFSVPILKVGQSLTREVQNGDAEVGEFINTLTGESLGNKVELIISFYNKGRFASDKKNNRAYVAFGQDIPDKWADFVGEDYVGTAFSEHPEGEEQFKAAVNAKEREWGKGPEISTTHNYTGFLVVEGEDGEKDYQPVRLSMKRTDVPAHKKIASLIRMTVRPKPSWDVVFQLVTKSKESNGYTSYVIDPTQVKVVRPTTASEKAGAANLAIAVDAGRVRSDGADEALNDTAAEPVAAPGAIAV